MKGWVKIRCPLSEDIHYCVYNQRADVIICTTCFNDERELTSFDMEVMLAVKFLKYQEENSWVFGLEQFENGRFLLPEKAKYTHRMNLTYLIVDESQKDKEGNTKRRWITIGSAFFYDDGTASIQFDAIPVNFNGRCKLYHPQPARNDKPEFTEPVGTPGFGSE